MLFPMITNIKKNKTKTITTTKKLKSQTPRVTENSVFDL